MSLKGPPTPVHVSCQLPAASFTSSSPSLCSCPQSLGSSYNTQQTSDHRETAIEARHVLSSYLRSSGRQAFRTGKLLCLLMRRIRTEGTRHKTHKIRRISAAENQSRFGWQQDGWPFKMSIRTVHSMFVFSVWRRSFCRHDEAASSLAATTCDSFNR